MENQIADPETGFDSIFDKFLKLIERTRLENQLSSVVDLDLLETILIRIENISRDVVDDKQPQSEWMMELINGDLLIFLEIFDGEGFKNPSLFLIFKCYLNYLEIVLTHAFLITNIRDVNENLFGPSNLNAAFESSHLAKRLVSTGVERLKNISHSLNIKTYIDAYLSSVTTKNVETYKESLLKRLLAKFDSKAPIVIWCNDNKLRKYVLNNDDQSFKLVEELVYLNISIVIKGEKFTASSVGNLLNIIGKSVETLNQGKCEIINWSYGSLKVDLKIQVKDEVEKAQFDTILKKTQELASGIVKPEENTKEINESKKREIIANDDLDKKFRELEYKMKEEEYKKMVLDNQLKQIELHERVSNMITNGMCAFDDIDLYIDDELFIQRVNGKFIDSKR